MYYTGVLNCTILALAPRLPIHPIYGEKKEKGKMPFLHNLKLEVNNYITPIIVYDPQDKIDATFVENEVLNAYPNAHFNKIQYGGHGMAPHLLRMGLLKEFILSVIVDDKVPVYKRNRKVKSANYCRLLGRKCLKRNKISWAKDLADRAYELLPENQRVVMFKVDVLIKTKDYDDAETYINIAIEAKPKNLALRMKLIDIYILQGELIKADRELIFFESTFGIKPQIKAKKRKLDNTYKTKLKLTSDKEF